MLYEFKRAAEIPPREDIEFDPPRGFPIERATRRDVGGNGNGALMRVLPLALWHRDSDAELVRDARASSAVTHGHVRSQLCCAFYCLWARQLLVGDLDAWASAERSLFAALPPDDHEARAELNQLILPELELGDRIRLCRRHAAYGARLARCGSDV